MYILYAGAEWDEDKRLANVLKHGVDFVDAARIFEGRVEVTEECQREYGENGFSALGEFEERLFYVVYTRRGDNLRIISARRAGRHERGTYYKGRV
jgi:uncharacterized protein